MRADVERVRSFDRLQELQVEGFVYDVVDGLAQPCGMISAKRAPLLIGS